MHFFWWIKEFSRFFDIESAVANDPVYSKEALTSKDKKEVVTNTRSTKVEVQPVCSMQGGT